MARRKKPYEFCEIEWQNSQEGSGAHQLAIEFYPENGLFAAISFALGRDEEIEEISADFTFSYCPFCGRKVGY